LAGQFTDVAILQLVDSGKLRLDESICSAITGCPVAWRQVTVRDLETYRMRFMLPHRGPPGTASLARWIDAMRDERPLRSPIGDRTGSTLVLQYIIEAKAGTSWWNYVSANILRRAGMTETGYDGPDRVGHRATPYDGTRPLRPRDAAATADRSDGIVSSVTDVLRYSRALDDGTLLSDAMRAEMSELVPGSFVKGSYGVWRYGWLVTRLFGHRFEGEHAHGEAGWSTWLIRLPDDRITVLLFQNRTNGSGNLANDLVRSLLGCPVGAPPTPKPC
jgi:CubicO group peptidase (beta-lactamase class C family)